MRIELREHYHIGDHGGASSEVLQVQAEGHRLERESVRQRRQLLTFPTAAAFCCGEASGLNSCTVPPSFSVSSTTFFSSLWIWATSAPERSAIVQWNNACVPGEVNCLAGGCGAVVVLLAYKLKVQTGRWGRASDQQQQR
jgi:hypothetical protein